MQLESIICYENINLLFSFIVALYITSSFWFIKAAGDALDISDEELMNNCLDKFMHCFLFVKILGIVICCLFFNMFWLLEIAAGLALNFVVDFVMIIIYVIFFIPRQSLTDIENIDEFDDIDKNDRV